MNGWHLLAYFWGGAFLSNVVPHLVSGQRGEPFQSPFAKPPGQGLSSSRVNVLWAYFNLGAAYLLLVQVGSFDLRNSAHVAATVAGAMLLAVHNASHFGKFHGGNAQDPGLSQTRI